MTEARARVLLMFVMSVAAIGILVYLVIFLHHEGAIGAALGLSGLAGSYVFRGRVETPRS